MSGASPGRSYYEEQLRKAEELLRQWHGEGYREKLASMDRAKKEALAAELFSRGVKNAFALTKALGLQSEAVREVVKKMKQLEAEKEEERRRAEEERLRAGKHVADKKAAEALRAAREDSRRPILVKEIEDAAWFHNLLHDVGKYVYHRLVKYVEWTEEKVRDEEKAFEAIAGYLDSMMEVAEKAHVLEELKVENMALDAYLTFSLDLLAKARDRLAEYMRFTEVAARTICPRCRAKLMAHLVAMQAAGGPGEVKA
jgi:hypothetical protein